MMNGIYTWPLMGFDQSLDSLAHKKAKLVAKVLAKYPRAKSVSDVMTTKRGPAWWKKNGSGLADARFDLTEGSRSRTMLTEYLAERKQRKAK